VEEHRTPIGYIEGRGPGGGAWPFWLSAIMLVCCGIIAFNWWRRTSPPSQSEEPFLDSYGWRMVGLVGGGVVVFVALIEVISMYGAIAVFLLYYLRFLGRHSWGLTLTIPISGHAASLLLLLRRRDADHDAHGAAVHRSAVRRPLRNHLLGARGSWKSSPFSATACCWRFSR
jgi:hypothetical protein